MSDPTPPKPSTAPDLETLRRFFETGRDLFAVFGADGRFFLVNPAWTQATGWTADELIGKSPLSFVHLEDRAGFVAMAEALRRDGVGENVARVRCKDGRWLWFEGRNRLTPSGQFVAILRDVSDERARDAELQASRRNAALLSEAAGIGAWGYEPIEDCIWWSDDILTLIGWMNGEAATGAGFYDIVDPAEVEAVRAGFQHAVQTGEGGVIEHRLRAADGRWLTMRATFRTEPRPGGVHALMGISQNVTELVEARDAAIRSERRVRMLVEAASANAQRLRLALNAAEAGAFEVNHAIGAFWGSDRFFNLIGRRIDYREAAQPCWSFVHPEDQPILTASNLRWAAGEQNHSSEFRIFLPDRTERWLRFFYFLDPESRKGVGLVMDITAAKTSELALIAAEQTAQAASEAKDRFLANVSHELRTPMNGVLGVMHLLERENLTEDGRQLLAEAQGCGEMLTGLLDDVIDLSRIEAGRLSLQVEPVDAAALARGVIQLLLPQAERKGVSLTLENPHVLGWIRTDPLRLRQTLFNLVGNAVKFTLQGHVTVRCIRPDDETLTFEVEDTGVGIPLEAQAGLFERFHQADASTTRRFGGSGLGLSITLRLAEMMGGGVRFTSMPGEGSVFRLQIAAPRTAPVEARPAEIDAGTDALRVLVVEDNATNRMIATRLLETLGCVVETAEDGVSGVAAAADGVFDVILMDIQMPGIDGVEAARRIRELPGPAGRVPVVALTANVLAHQRDHYVDAGMQGVISKPISPVALAAELGRVMAEVDARDAASRAA